MTGSDNDFAGFDPGTTSGVDAPESASSSADTSTGFDFSDDPGFFTSVNDPFSYYDPVTEAYFAGSPGTGGASKDYGIDYTDAYYNYVPGLASNAVARGISDDAFFAALSERLGVPFGGGRDYGIDYNERYIAPEVPGVPFGGGRDYGIDYNERYVAPEVPVEPSDTRGLASVVAGTPPTQPSTFDRPAYGDSSTAYRQAIDALSRMGYGNMEGANPNNPTQTVDQMIAANNVSNFLEKYAPTIFGAATGFGPHLNAIRMGADVLSGKTTPGQALTGIGLELAASKLGLPGGGRVLGDVLDGRMDRAASGLTQAGLAAALGRAAGIPAPLAGIALQETGLGPKAGAAVGNAIGPSQPTGATSSIAQFFDKGLGGLKGIFSGLPQGDAGTAPMSQTAGVPTYAYAGDSSPDSPATVAAPASSATTATSTAPEVQAARRLLYGLAKGPYGPLLAYDIGERG